MALPLSITGEDKESVTAQRVQADLAALDISKLAIRSIYPPRDWIGT